MKIAVCFSGYPRFYDRIDLSDYGDNVSIFYHSWDDTYEELIKDSCVSNFSSNVSVDKYVANDSLKDYLKPTNIKVESFCKKRAYFENLYRRFRNCEGRTRRSVFPMYYSVSESIKLALNYSEKFDIIVRTRFDIRLEQPINYAIDETLHIPDQFHYFGINDQLCYGPPSLMKKYADVYSYITSIPNLQLNPEILLKKHLHKQKIPTSLTEDWFYLLR